MLLLDEAVRIDAATDCLQPNRIYLGDAQEMLDRIREESVSLSFWSPPYHVGKEYEQDHSVEDWLELLNTVIEKHYRILKPGGFLVINVDDILAYPDPTMPRIQATVKSRQRVALTKEQILDYWSRNPEMTRRQVAEHFGCSEQTIDRRLNGNNIRGGKYATQTRIKFVPGILEEYALSAGLYPYDRRMWVKDPAWATCRWHSNTYRSVSEFEYLLVYWKPGETVVDRTRLTRSEWVEWGSRGVWNIPSVRRNDDHPAKFPLELARRVVRLFSGPGDTVLDCFVGSGTTAIAALVEGRKFVGIDKEPRYVELARRQIEESLDAERS